MPFDASILRGLSGLQFRARYLVEGVLNGLHESPFRGFSSDFSEYRDYQQGDDLRHLDWRFYARADKLCIRRYEQETNLNFYVVCDSSASMAYAGTRAWASKLDAAKTLAASFAWLLLKQKDSVGLLTFATPFDAETATVGEAARHRTPPGLAYLRHAQKPSQFGHFLGQLEPLRPQGGPCLAALLDSARVLVPRRSVVLVVSDWLDPNPELRHQLEHLRFLGHEILVWQVLDPDEIDFPFTDGSVFEDLETRTRRRVAPARVREGYLARFQQFQDELAGTFRAMEILHQVIRTDVDPGTALATFLTQRRLLA